MATLYLLYESASGYALFERVEAEEIGQRSDQVQEAIADLARFSKIIKLKAFSPFTSAENALDQINHISEGEMTVTLKDFLELNLPQAKPGKLTKYILGVMEPKVGSMVQETLGIKCESSEIVHELLRGIRLHFARFIKNLKQADVMQAQLGLAHSYSRSKVKFNVNKVDNMIIQAIALVDQLDKDLNTFAMRVREWYSWHFPELIRVVNDNYQFCKLVALIQNRSSLSEDSIPALQEVTQDEQKAREIVEAAKMSMGTDISEIDMVNIQAFATRVIKLAECRTRTHQYLVNKMHTCAPSLSALIGEMVGARLISHAGSLTNLAKYPASTVQILGAEKALFRALKTRGNTPKYGLLFHSPFIGRAAPKNKGRISRYLANKCSIASRIDCFSEIPSEKFGEKLKEQVEERLEFFKSGKTPHKNAEVMASVLAELGGDITKQSAADLDESKEDKPKKKKDKKRKSQEAEAPAANDDGAAPMEVDGAAESSNAEPKKKKKSKEADD